MTPKETIRIKIIVKHLNVTEEEANNSNGCIESEIWEMDKLHKIIDEAIEKTAEAIFNEVEDETWIEDGRIFNDLKKKWNIKGDEHEHEGEV